jgi:hypothetical protein
MPQITAETPRADITIQGLVFSCPQPYGAGHALSENEAAALNQVFAENVRNNCASRVKAAVAKREKGEEAPTDEALLTEFEDYAVSYEFGVRRSSGVSEARLTPEEREARRLAGDRIKEALKAKGFTIKSVGQEKFDSMVDELSRRDDIVKLARKRVNDMQKIGLDELNLDLGEEGEQAAA